MHGLYVVSLIPRWQRALFRIEKRGAGLSYGYDRVRYVFSSPPVWTEDIARYAMVWTGLLGATLSFKTQSDAVLMQSVFPDPPHVLGLAAKALESVAVMTFILPVIYFCFVGLKGGFAKGYLARQSGLTADTLGIPIVWISVAVPISMIIILIHLMARWAGDDLKEI